jgi:transcription elongation factor Elf1
MESKHKKYVTIPCPDCNEPQTFLVYKGCTISPIICKKCHAMLEIDYEDDWVLYVIDRVEN